MTDDVLLKSNSDVLEEEENIEETSPDELYERLVQKALNRLDWCKASRDRRESELRWEDAQNFWRGKQWDGIKSYGVPGRSSEEKKLHANPVNNYVKAFTEGVVGDVTDRPVDIQVKPRGGDDDRVAKSQGALAQYLWYINKGDRKMEFIVRRGVLYGPLIAKVYWDPDWRGTPENPFIGNIRFFNVLPTNIFIDPRVKAVEEGAIQEGDFVIYCVRRSLSYIRKRHPERGHEVTADTYAGYVTTLTQDEDSDIYIDDTDVLLIEYWYKGDPLAPEFPRTEEETSEPLEGREDWVHKAVIAGGVLLEHRTYVYPKFPFVMEWMYPSDESIYGYGDAHDILIPQLVLNKLDELSIEGAALQAYGSWITEEGNIRNKAQFQKYAGMGNAVLPVVDVQRTQRQFGANVPQSLFVHYRQELQAMETICGRYDVAQGKTPRNIQAASAIALLLQQAGGRVRQRARALSSFVEQIVRMVLDLASRYYTEERMIRIVGADGEVSWEPMSRNDIIAQRVRVNPLSGEQTVEEYLPEYDIVVTAGTETPASKAYYSDLAIRLFQLGVIDDIALLDTLQFPGWRDIIDRVRNRAMTMASPQAAQGASPGGQEQGFPGGVPNQAPAGGGNEPPAMPAPALSPELLALRGAAETEENPLQRIGGAAPAEEPSPEVIHLLQLLAQLQGGGAM